MAQKLNQVVWILWSIGKLLDSSPSDSFSSCCHSGWWVRDQLSMQGQHSTHSWLPANTADGSRAAVSFRETQQKPVWASCFCPAGCCWVRQKGAKAGKLKTFVHLPHSPHSWIVKDFKYMTSRAVCSCVFLTQCKPSLCTRYTIESVSLKIRT